MIIKTEVLKDVCGKIGEAVDTKAVSTLTKSVELSTEGTFLCLSVTNREYFVKVKIDIGEKVDFHATVDAGTFLKLISQITTDTVELTATDTTLNVVGNGKYKLPLVMGAQNEMLELPQIEINNVTNDFYINSAVLLSILKYNTPEFNKGTISKAVQKTYYVDDEGAITFTSGACVNTFTLSESVKLLFNPRLVNLFKLFKDGDVHFVVGYDRISDEIVQTKVRFESNDVTLESILSCSTADLIKSVPVKSIRQRATKDYPNTAHLNKDELKATLARLDLFVEELKPYIHLEFDKDQVVISDVKKDNKETLYYGNSSSVSDVYETNLNINDLKITINNAETDVQFNFGDAQAIVMVAGSIKNVIPEIKLG